jgi:hypothetical protein
MRTIVAAAAAGAVAFGLLLAGAPAGAVAEPRPGSIPTLRLAAPEDAAESFARAWSAADYFVAYLALDPELRFRFEERMQTFDYGAILGGDHDERILEALVLATADSQRPGRPGGIVVDRFAEFDGLMTAAREFGSLPFAIGPSDLDLATSAMVERVGDDLLARVELAGGGAAMVMRQSPGGRWRLAGFEGLALPPFWLFDPR